MRARTACGLMLAALLVGVNGCGSGPATVTGRLTYKEEPVPCTEVYFHPDSGSRQYLGRTDDEGRFSLRYGLQENRAPCGRYTVTLLYAPSTDEETHQVPPKASRELKEIIARYGNPATSKLQCEITTSGQFIEIRLDESR